MAKNKHPFKSFASFEKDIKTFLNKYKKTIAAHSKKASSYFEMTCYNKIVSFYENNGYTATIENLQAGKYRYKCSTSGIQSNFSNFKIEKRAGRKSFAYDIHHNLAVQSYHSQELFTTPDISVIKAGTVKERTDYYDTKIRFCYSENKDLQTFCEVKNFTPFPELIFNFIGIVNELKGDIIAGKPKSSKLPHIAPSLLISGKANKPTSNIKDGLEKRYRINIFYDLYDAGANIFALYNNHRITVTSKQVKRIK